MCFLVLAVSSAAAQSLPAGWTGSDVGRPALRGSATFRNGSFTLAGGGTDVWGTSDQFMFVHRRLTGDGTIIARVTAVQGLDEWTKAGVMMRESLAPGSRHAFALVSVGRGVAFQRRRVTGNGSFHTGASGKAPTWVKLQREGTLFTASRSADGVRWTTIGTESIAMPATIYVGLAVTNKASHLRAQASFSSLAIGGPAPARLAPAASRLPDGWASADVGRVGRTGAVTLTASMLKVKGAGADIWGSSDQFRFTYRKVTGDVDVVARVAAIDDVDSWSKAGVMLRRSLSAGSAHASLFVSARNGVAFQRRIADGAQSVHTGAGGRTAPWWLKLSRRGSAITAYQSADGVRWSFVGVERLSLASSFYVGLAVTSHRTSTLVEAAFSHVSVRPAQLPTESQALSFNTDPVVSFTSPATGATFVGPATISLTAAASDADGAVTRVDFYAGTLQIGSDTSAPYAATWKNVPIGTHSLTAVARDNRGGTTVSSTKTVAVLSGSAPRRAVFAPSPEHATAVDRYVVEFFRAGVNPSVSNPVAVADIGKPRIVNGECQADVSRTIAGLPAGTYVATITAVGFTGQARSAPSPLFTIGTGPR